MVSHVKNTINMNLLKQIAIFIFIIFSMSTKAQNINEFYFEVSRASKLAQNGKTDSAITIYENAFKKVNYVQIRYLNKVLELAKLNEDKERVKIYSQQIKKQSEGTNSQLKAIIDSLIIVDQKIRTGKSAIKSRYAAKCDYKQNCNKKSKKYKKSKIALENWVKTDSLNTNTLLTLFKQYGYLGEELVGHKRSGSVFVMLLHYDQDINNTVLGPVLEKARKEGKISALDFATILDRHLGGKPTIQKYWFWPYVGKEKLQFSEADIPKIIKLRESIGIYGVGLKQEEYKKGRWRLINYTK